MGFTRNAGLLRGWVAVALATALAAAVPGVAAAASGWTFQPVPLPIGDTGALSGVTCTSATNCLAVGAIYDNGDALGEHWDGSTWTAQDIAVPGSSSASLSAVSCASSDSCTAVGMYQSSTENKTSPLAEHWDGSTWTMQTTPAPLQAGGRAWVLKAISCRPSGVCLAVGAKSPLNFPLAMLWNGTKWTIRGSVPPSGDSAAVFTGVHCFAKFDCTVVGSASEPGTVPLAEHWNGRSWHVQTMPNVIANDVTLSAISCISRAQCTVVGSFTGSASTGTMLAESWDGNVWSLESTAVLPGVNGGTLLGVSCVNLVNCTAAGYFTLAQQHRFNPTALAERWNSAHFPSWTKQEAAQSAKGMRLAGVSCLTHGFCMAVGYTQTDTPVSESRTG